MKRNLLCFAVALAVVLTLPAAAFASNGQKTVSGGPLTIADRSDGWLPATDEILEAQAMILAAAATDSSIVIDDEKNCPAADAAEPDSNSVIADTDWGISDGDSGVSTMSTTTSNIGASRYSGTSGKVSVYASFDRKATTASCTIALQEKYNGSWRAATGIPVKIYSKTVYDSYSITAARTFTLVKGKVYRAKISVIDKNSAGTHFKTLYTGSF